MKDTFVNASDGTLPTERRARGHGPDGAGTGWVIAEEAVSQARLNDGTASDYGFGWSVITDERRDVVAHGGGWAGFSPFFVRDYHNGNTVIQLTNRPGIRRGELAFAIYEIMHGGEVALPEAAMDPPSGEAHTVE